MASAAWVQAVADGGFAVRATTAASDCPRLRWEDGEQRMALRVAPGTAPARQHGEQADTKASRFPERTCEAALPQGAHELRVGTLKLKAPPATLRRIVLVGDTGCRMKQSEDAFQDCSEELRWPWAEVARSAAALHPDLVVHVGDYHYRESPCPAGNAGCTGSPWGYGQDVWQADFFTPAAPLLAAAPWVFVRGNHESCKRAGVGWFRYLDGHDYDSRNACEDAAMDAEGDFGQPYTVPLGGDWQLIVFDSAFVGARAYAAGDPVLAHYVAQLGQARALAGHAGHSIFINHHPVLAFGGSDDGRPKASGAGLRSAMAAAQPGQLFPAGVELVVNGHVHLFEALDFDGLQPAELLVGNAGSASEGHVDAPLALRAKPAPGVVVRSFVTQPGYGFATLDRTDEGWLMTERDVHGRPLLTCQLAASRWACGAPSKR